MFYTIYQTTNLLDGKIYVGKHQTEDPNDSYLGSGGDLLEAIDREGIENFSKQVLFIFNSEEQMNAKEAELVDWDFILRDDTYNRSPGGDGGWSFVNQHKDAGVWRSKGGVNSYALGKFAIAGEEHQFQSSSLRAQECSSQGNEKRKRDGVSLETRHKISEYQTQNNSMKDRAWVFRDGIKKVVHISELDQHREDGWSIPREQKLKSTLWMHREGINSLINRERLQEYLSTGWKEGREKRSK